MVVFCESCGVSLPGIDYMVVDGKEVALADFICPHCNKKANLSYKDKETKDEIIPADKEVVIVKNSAIQRKKVD